MIIPMISTAYSIIVFMLLLILLSLAPFQMFDLLLPLSKSPLL